MLNDMGTLILAVAINQGWPLLSVKLDLGAGARRQPALIDKGLQLQEYPTAHCEAYHKAGELEFP